MDGFERMRGTDDAQEPPETQIHIGLVLCHAPDGLAVLFGLGWGFCYEADIEPGIDWRNIEFEARIEIRIISAVGVRIRALKLLRVLDARPMVEKPVQDAEAPHRKHRPDDLGRAAVSGGLTGDSYNWTIGLKKVLDKGTADINEGFTAPNTLRQCLAGKVTETHHEATFNVDAGFNRSGWTAKQLELNKLNSVDVTVSDPRGEVVKQYQLKTYKDAQTATARSTKYPNQDPLVPTDKLDEVRGMAAAKAVKKALKADEASQDAAAKYQRVADRATDRLEGGGNESQPLTYEESQELADKVKGGNVTTVDIVGSMSKRVRQGATQGAKSGAIGGAAVSAAIEGVGAVMSVRRGEKTVREAAEDAAFGVGEAALAGALKGAASGAATAAARVMAEKATNETVKNLLGSSLPAAVAVGTVEVAISAVGYARGVKTGPEFRRSVVKTVGTTGGGAAGAKLGRSVGDAVGYPFIGALLGGLAGAILGGWIADGVSDALEGPARGGGRAAPRPPLPYGGNPGPPGPQGGDPAFAYRMEQFGRLLRALEGGSSLVYPGRLLIQDNYHVATDLLMAHEGAIFAVDFKAWKGILTPSENGKTQFGEPLNLIKTRFNRDGTSRTEEHLNPVLNISRFARAARERLRRVDPRWDGIEIKPLIVHPDDSLTLGGRLSGDSRFLSFSSFLSHLRTITTDNTYDWMHDGLSSIPTWDTVQDRFGTVRQGVIRSPSFVLHMSNGSTEIPYASIIKLEIEHELDGCHAARVTFRGEQTITGTVSDQNIILSHKGHKTTFKLNEMRVVCPTYLLFTV